MDCNNVIKLAVDAIQNTVPNNYDKNETSEVLREAFIEANGGSAKIDFKSFRDHPELFQIVEAIIPAMIEEGFKGDEFFMNFVDYRNLALGDEIDFWTEDNSLFVVSDVAEGTQAIRRQRLDAGSKVSLVPTLKVIKVYEELNRLIARRVDFNRYVQAVNRSFAAQVYDDIYDVFNGISATTTGMTSDYYKTGTYAESTLLTLIDHVESATGSRATLLGTRAAIRKVTQGVVADSAREDYYNFGHYGKFNGTPIVIAPQRHAIGASSFALDDTKIYVVASNDKFLKCVNGGEGFLFDGNPMDKTDLTKEYLYGQRFKCAALINERLGVYDLD